MELTQQDIERVVAAALAEDVGDGDATTLALVAGGRPTAAPSSVLEEPGVVCGLPVAAAVFRALDPSVTLDGPLVAEGAARHDVPAVLARGRRAGARRPQRRAASRSTSSAGSAGSRPSTRRFVELTSTGRHTAVLDTRKTTPGLRALEKYAVRCGGGTNHRAGLYDGVLVKENHLRLAGGIARRGSRRSRGRVDGLPGRGRGRDARPGARGASTPAPPRILLDNMTPAGGRRGRALVGGRAELEASGGVSLATVRAYAETGVDFVSVGALTHSARSLHVSLEVP